MFLVELIASSFLDLISKQARPECLCKRVLVEFFKVNKGLRIHPRHTLVTNMRKTGVCLSNFCGTYRIAVNAFD